MPWLELNFIIEKTSAETLSALLLDYGAFAVTFKDAGNTPILEPALNTTPLWQQTQIVGLFPMGTATEQVMRHLEQHFYPRPLPPCHWHTLADQIWELTWMEHYKPLCFAQRLWICPSYCQAPPGAEIVVSLDPGLAFGSGTHATTRLCLEWLVEHLPHNAQVLDFGCGCGVLAISAAKLGAQKIWAVDIDPQALMSTQDNAQRNGVASQLLLSPPAVIPPQTFDVIIANILASTLIDLSIDLAKYAKTGSHLVLSGILTSQTAAVMMAFQDWYDFKEPVMNQEWVLLWGIRRC